MKTVNAHRDRNLLLAATLTVLCAPVLLDLLADCVRTPLRYFAADTFYYLVVARNWANTGVFSFDQTHPTNGFHPLWQMLTAIVYKLGHLFALSDHGCLIIVFLMSIALVAIGLVLIGLAIAKHKGHLPLLFVASPVGAYALAMLPVWLICSQPNLINTYEGPFPLYGTLWSFMNGMESGLAIASFGAMALCFSANTRQRLLPASLLGLTAAMLTFSRLDHVFIAAGVFLAHSIPVLRQRDRHSFLYLGVTGFVFATPILLYVWHNAVSFGSLVPISGVTKSTFPIPHFENIRLVEDVLLHPFRDHWWLDLFYRLAQMLLPFLAAIFFFLARFRNMRFSRIEQRSPCRKDSRLETFLLGSGLGIIVLGLYNFFFVIPTGPGHWYFPVSIPYITICLIVLLPDRVQNWQTRFLVVVLVGAVCLGVFWKLQRRIGYHQSYINFYLDEAPRVKAYYGAKQPRLIEYDDGIVSYATGFPAMSGFGYAIDREGKQAIVKGDFSRLALERGFDRVTSLVYVNFAKQDIEEDMKTLNVFEKNFGLSNDNMVFRKDYLAKDSTFGIIQFAHVQNIPVEFDQAIPVKVEKK